MDDFVENLVVLGGFLAVVCIPLGLAIAFFSGFASAAIPLTAGSIGLVIYFISSWFDR